jgi:hypothetical protein
VQALEARAVQVRDQRTARRRGDAHEQHLAPEARAGFAVRVQHHAAVVREPACKQHREPAQRAQRGERAFQRAAFDARGDVVYRPAPEEAVHAVRLDHGGDAAARPGRGAEHDEPGFHRAFPLEARAPDETVDDGEVAGAVDGMQSEQARLG